MMSDVVHVDVRLLHLDKIRGYRILMTMVLENLPANVLCSSAHNIVGEPRIGIW